MDIMSVLDRINSRKVEVRHMSRACIPVSQRGSDPTPHGRLRVQVWHNYSFDRHILQRRGLGIPAAQLDELGLDPDSLSLSLAGFAGDTMHMARLHDAARKGTKNYSLASLTSDKSVMCSPDRSVLSRSKVSMKELFSKPKISKSGKPSASLKELPPIHELQVCDGISFGKVEQPMLTVPRAPGKREVLASLLWNPMSLSVCMSWLAGWLAVCLCVWVWRALCMVRVGVACSGMMTKKLLNHTELHREGC